MTQPLTGIRILDLTHVWAGPLAVRFLSDLGAEVVKVEAPYGRGPREFPYAPLGGWLGGDDHGEPWNANAIFVKLHRNRQSLCLDLKEEAGLELFLSLVEVADVVIENFSARAMPSMGLDYEVLRRANPNIIYVTMPGFGSTGPYSDRVAFGPIVEPMSGLTQMLGYGPDSPRNSAMALMDPITGTHAYAAVVAALQRRNADGHGSRVELSLHEGGVSYSGPWLLDTQAGRAPHCVGNRHPAMAPHNVYPCKGDDAWIAVACPTEASWRALAELIGFEPLPDLESRKRDEESIDAAVAAWTCNRGKEEAAILLQEHGIAAGPVNTTPDMCADPQVQARGFFDWHDRFDTPMPGSPIQASGVKRETWTVCPLLGEHNAEVLSSWLGYDQSEVNDLTSAGILFDAPPG